ADDAGALDVPTVGAQSHLRHLVEDPALDRLQPVASVGQGARVDHRVGVLEERGLHPGRDIDVFDVLVFGQGVEGVSFGSHKIGVMLPGLSDTAASLADVLGDSLAAIIGEPTKLGLAGVDRAAVLLIDGLGADNLRSRSGHARTLSGAMHSKSSVM